MRLIKIAEVKDLENKEAIPSLRGTLTRVYEYKIGEGQYGAYSFQNGQIKDDSGESQIVFSNHPDIKGFLNREIFIKSHSGDKGLTGIIADDNKYKDKMTRQIKVTATADISLIDGSSKAVDGPKTRPDSETVSGQPKDAVNALRHGLMKVLNAFYVIERGVSVQVEQSKIDGIETTPENFGGKCAQAYRTLDSMGLIQALPEKPLWGAEKQLVEKPAEDEDIPWQTL